MRVQPLALPLRQVLLNRIIWYAVAELAAIDLLWIWAAGLKIDISHSLIFFPIFIACLALSAVYRYLRPDDGLWLLGQVTCQLLAAAGALGVFSYLAAREPLPLADGFLAGADALLFFNWRAYVLHVAQFALLAKLFSCAYLSSGPQLIGLLCLLFFFQHLAQAQRFIVAFFCAAMMIIVLAAFFPAMGGYEYYHVDPAQFPALHPEGAILHAQTLSMLRGGVDTIVFPLKGIIMFPSFHSALSVLLVYACLPMRRLLYLVVPLNLLVLLATPVDGGHYLIDILAGMMIAWVAVATAEYALPRKISPSRAFLRM